MKTIVVFDKDTREILLALPLKDGKLGIAKDGIDFQIYDNEPVFENRDGSVFLSKNKFGINFNEL